LSAFLLAPALLASTGAQAHFQELLPSADIVPETGDRTVTLDLTFTHPMDGGPVMEMGRPAQFGVLVDGRKHDLTAALREVRRGGNKTAYQASYTLGEPADYVFYVEPAPYWEPAEGKFIVHYTKVVVDFASGEGWDKPVGLPVEIEPLVRPYGLWTGSLFRGVVRKNGTPVPFAEIEVEWKNDGSVTVPADPFVTQVIKADASGQFAFAMPRAGWWGFAALLEGDKPMKNPEGKPAPVETGALIWVKTTDMQ
jgi:ABC-type Co2+ transport system, periplasmic component